MESIWNDMDASSYYANSNISLKEEEIIFFLNLYDIGEEFVSLTEINNVIETVMMIKMNILICWKNIASHMNMV